jgi:hypothetical protein
MDFDDFLNIEYEAYKNTTQDPMEFDDWFKGSDYLNFMYEQLKKEG